MDEDCRNWIALVGVAATFVGFVAGHRLNLFRDRRVEFNAFVAPIHKMAFDDIRSPNAMTGISVYTVDRLIAFQPWHRRRACRRAIEHYERAKRDGTGQEPQYGTAIITKPEPIRAAARTFLKFVEPR